MYVCIFVVQHYMLNGEVNEQLVNAANVGDGDVVLEIGPGTGSLTNVLVESGANVLAIEKVFYYWCFMFLLNARFFYCNIPDFSHYKHIAFHCCDVFRIRTWLHL